MVLQEELTLKIIQNYKVLYALNDTNNIYLDLNILKNLEENILFLENKNLKLIHDLKEKKEKIYLNSSAFLNSIKNQSLYIINNDLNLYI